VCYLPHDIDAAGQESDGDEREPDNSQSSEEHGGNEQRASRSGGDRDQVLGNE
jgi:hypothetical protein